MTQRDERNSQLAIDVPPQPNGRGALAEYCVKCGAGPGERCRTSGDELASYEHSDRRRAAMYLPVPR